MNSVFIGLKRLATKDSEGIKAGDIVEVVNVLFRSSGVTDGWEDCVVNLKNLRTTHISSHGSCVLGPTYLDTVEVPKKDEQPRWLKVVGQIMTKAAEHKKAGRVNFQQVLVPLEDYKALAEHFDMAPGCGPEVSTVIGPVSVYPTNPSGITFVD